MVVSGAVVIAGIGFAGSYAAVRELALKKGFGNFAYVFPVGIDAGICVLLALDLLLTWIRIPFPLLRQTAWLLTVATIAFNGAAAWPDPLGVGMHAVIPILFVVCVEAARHAIGRIADMTADQHMEGVRLTRWLLSPLPTFLLWRRMKLWELRSYAQVIKLEQDRLVYQTRLHSRYGRTWRRKAPVETLIPLRLARYGIPLAQTAPTGLAAAGIDPELPPPTPQVEPAREPQPQPQQAPVREQQPPPAANEQPQQQPQPQEFVEQQSPWLQARAPQPVAYQGGYHPTYDPDTAYQEWHAEQQHAEHFQQYEEEPLAEPSPEDTATFPIPAGPGRTRELDTGSGTQPAPPRNEQDPGHGLQGSDPPGQQGNTQHHKPGDNQPPQQPPHVHHSRQTANPPSDEPLQRTAHDGSYSPGERNSPMEDAHEHGPRQQKHPEQERAGDEPTAAHTARDNTAFAATPSPATTPPHQPGHSPTAASSVAADPMPLPRQTQTPPTGHDSGPTTAGPPAEPTHGQPTSGEETTPPPRSPTPVDRYYLAWQNLHQHHKTEPDATELSAYLASQGILDRNNQPLRPKTLARYFLQFRIYTIWAHHRALDDHPDPHHVAKDLTQHGITAQYNQPIHPHHLEKHHHTFEHRWQALHRQEAP
ncbi:Protein of unknown function [Streptomyces sp. 3213]|nr:Protein of unknown function [Streptomyces sp. 3213] [Streptomyces sp. 3213.3]